MKTKSILQSKTFWMNVIAFLLLLLPMVQGWLKDSPERGVVVLGVLNLLVRLVTDSRISIFEAGGPAEGHGGNHVPLWVGTAMVGCLCMGSLPSCSAEQRAVLKDVPMQACYLGEHGERICYSTKEGVLVEVDRRSSK